MIDPEICWAIANAQPIAAHASSGESVRGGRAYDYAVRCSMPTKGRTEAERISNQIVIDPEIMHGEPVFKGTRVPIKILFDHLAAGDPLDVFLEDFPYVSREQALAVIGLAGDGLLSGLRAA